MLLAQGGPFGAMCVVVHVLLGCSLPGAAEASVLSLLPKRVRTNFCVATTPSPFRAEAVAIVSFSG
ncbi:MAG: hypothetical protein QXS54_11465 [Candidatus Methanomethylicaceae archaeon]